MKWVQRPGPKDNERWRHAQRLDQNSKILTHKVRILEGFQEQVENGSSRDCERVGVWDGASCLYVWGEGSHVHHVQRYVHSKHVCSCSTM